MINRVDLELERYERDEEDVLEEMVEQQKYEGLECPKECDRCEQFTN